MSNRNEGYRHEELVDVKFKIWYYQIFKSNIQLDKENVYNNLKSQILILKYQITNNQI